MVSNNAIICMLRNITYTNYISLTFKLLITIPIEFAIKIPMTTYLDVIYNLQIFNIRLVLPSIVVSITGC